MMNRFQTLLSNPTCAATAGEPLADGPKWADPAAAKHRLQAGAYTRDSSTFQLNLRRFVTHAAQHIISLISLIERGLKHIGG
jgi:hypothetical protein